ncbi:MAG TPA: response regulator [Candidatus Angelobacter sp.]|nr:response regulator [Candidatus Angelobacter sp.]
MAARIEPTLPYSPPVRVSPVKNQNRLKTVVANDSETFLEVLCDVLDLEDDIEVVAAACDGVEAIDEAVRLKPALILMDVHMPGLDGVSAASLLGEMTPAPVVVLMSSEDSRELRRAAERAGAFAFIHKPYLQQELPEVVDQILKARDQQWTGITD